MRKHVTHFFFFLKACSHLAHGYHVSTQTQRANPSGSVNEYQQRLGEG